ncbi:MAG TPA: LTA synthase family protein [Flavobacteriales bacterium]|nr:LTA synthase family protein [Flavobacteriales bacterium]
MRLIGLFAKPFLFLFLLFTLSRASFLISYSSELIEIGLSNILLSFYHAIPLDISAICYALALPFLLLLFQIFCKKNFLTSFINNYINIVILLIALVYAGETAVYKDWGVKLHYKIFIHLKNPSEMFHTAHFSHFLLFFLNLSFIGILGLYVYTRYFKLKQLSIDRYLTSAQGRIGVKVYHLAVYILVFTLMLFAMRGGFQPIPINQSAAFFSKHVILNDAAVNPIWNLAHSTIENYANLDNTNPYTYYNNDDAIVEVEKIHDIKAKLRETGAISTVKKILQNNKPNVVLIILESWSADIVGSLGSIQKITPEFDQLAKEGLLFSNIYASGYTSDLAMPAILSSFHALPIASIITQPSKFKKLHCISKSFKDASYYTSYHFGGQLIYGNIKGFLYHHQFDQIVEQKDLSDTLPAGKLGIHDEHMFDIFVEDLGSESSAPFFSALFTLSTHPPYDMPIKTMRKYSDYENQYLNAAHYTDSCLGLFFKKAKLQDWYDNTLFVMIADHSHHTPMRWKYCEPRHYKIPLLFYGNVIKEKYRGTINTHLGSQVDLAPTILNQLDLPFDKFPWGKDLLNTASPEFAFYTFYDGFGWIRPYGSFAYEKRYDKYFHKEIDDTLREAELIKEGRAYIQAVFQEYLDY